MKLMDRSIHQLIRFRRMFFFVIYSFFSSWRNSINVRKVCMYVYERDHTYIHVRATFLFLFFSFLFKERREVRSKKKEEES